MKRFLIIFMLVALLIPGFCYASEDNCRPMAAQTASALIQTGAAKLCSVTFANDGTNAVTINIYDNTSAAGLKIIPTIVAPASSSQRSKTFTFIPALNFQTGLYISVSVAGAGTVSYVPLVAPQ